MVPLLDELFRYVGFTEHDGRRLQAASDALRPTFDGIVEAFYVAIEANPEARAVFEDEAQVARQKRLLRGWLERFFTGPYDASYVEERSRIGRAHVRIRLPQRYMFVSMNIIRDGLTRAVWALTDTPLDRMALLQSIHRLCDVELAIMLETYREGYDRALRTAERLAALGQFAGTLAHEMRNPLAVLSTSSHLLRRHAGEAPAIARHVDRIERQVAVCGQIVEDLLGLARDTPPRVAPVDVARLVEIAWAQLTKPLHTLSLRVAPDAATVLADEGQLRQVLVNVMENATQAMPEGGVVDVDVHVGVLANPAGDLDGVVIRVEDTGPGFTPEALEHLFEPLFTTKARGIGLGLPLCHRVIGKHGGRLSVHNREPRGARVDITLPATTQGGGMRVLLVDDNLELADNLAELLTLDGTEVVTHHDPTRALDWARAHEFDAALLDVRMPVLGGVELMRQLRPAHPEARFVLMSAYTQDVRLDPASDRVDAVLTKPLDLRLLTRALGLEA